MNRHIPVVATVLLLHVVAIVALHAGLLRRVLEVVVPVQLLAIAVEQPKAEIAPPRSVPAPAPKPEAKAVVKPQQAVAPTPTLPPAVPEPAPVPTTTAPAPVSIAQAPVSTAPSALPATSATPGARTTAGPSTAPAPAPAPARVELPSSDAAYLQNPRPPYPAMSRRLNEQGTVHLNVLIGPDGLAQKAEIRQSSGFERLDRSAMETVMKWRYVPGKRDGVPEAMWFVIPLVFALE